MMPLGLLADGEQAMVVSISEKKEHAGGTGGCHACGKHARGNDHGAAGACAHDDRIADMGIRAGREVEMLRNPGRGPLLLKVDEARIAIGRSMAMRIFVRKKEPR